MGTFSKIVVSTCCLLIRALQHSYIVKGHCCPHYIGSFSGTSSALFVCLFDAGVVWVAFSCIYTDVTLWHVINEHKSGSRCGWPGVNDDIKSSCRRKLILERSKRLDEWGGFVRSLNVGKLEIVFFGRLNFFGQDLLLNHHIPLRCRMTPRRTKQCVCTVKKLKLIFFVSDYS